MNSLLKQLTAQLLHVQGSSGKSIETSTLSNNVSTNVTSITNNISNATCTPVGCGTGSTCSTATVSNVMVPQSNPQLAPPTQLQGIQFVIKVINPNSKRDFKTYTIRLKQVRSMTLKSLKEEILEQLGKSIVCFDLEFDVGYMMGTQKISFSETDDVSDHMQKILDKGYRLWCEGRDSRKRADHDLEEGQTTKPNPKKPKISAFEERSAQVLTIAKQLKEKHGDKYNMVQYKFWGETLVSKQYKNWEIPPPGLIWGNSNKESKHAGAKSRNCVDAEMMKSVGEMAIQIATAIKSPQKANNNPSETTGISPGRKIDMQGKLLQQLELVHTMFEKGAITTEQFEKRRESLMTQLEKLD